MPIDTITPFPFRVGPVTNISPVTYRDAETFLSQLESLKSWIADYVIPGLNTGYNQIIEEVNEGIANAEATVLEAKDEWVTEFNAYMVDVQASLTALNAPQFLKRKSNPVDYLGTATERLNLAVTGSTFTGVPLEVTETLTVTGNIVGFWDAHHQGTGKIVRDGATFHLEPRPTSAAVPVNNIYVNAATGNDANDGLSSTFPLKTLSKVYTGVLRRLTAEQAAGAKWVINLVGAFTRGQKFEDLPEFPHTLEFVGEPLVAGYPVTSISHGDGVGGKIGLWFEPGRATITTRNLLFKDFKNISGSYGILMKGGGSINAYYCRAENCDTGFAAIRNVDFLFDHCTTNNTTTTGFVAQYSSSGTFAYCDVDGASTGFYITRNSVAHVDYSIAMNCNRGVSVDMASRVNCQEVDFRKNATGVRASGAAEWINDECKFNIGTVNANTVNYAHYGVARETRLYSESARAEFKIGDSYTAGYTADVVHTGDVTNKLIYVGTALGTLPAGYFTNNGKRLRVEVWGRGALSADAKVRLYAYDDTTRLMSEATVSSSVDSEFKLEFVVWARDVAVQDTNYAVTAATGSRVNHQDRTIDFSTEKSLRLYVLLGASADTITIRSMETYLMG